MYWQQRKSSYVFRIYIYVYTVTLAHADNFSTIKYPIATTTPSAITVQYLLKRRERDSDYNEEDKMEDKDVIYDDYNDENKQIASAQRALKNDPWQGYYDFLINEGSFKFWAAFQVFTAAVLIYSAFAAVYYAKYNFIQSDYDYTDYFFGRSNRKRRHITSAIDVQTIQRIFEAISSKKFA